MTADCADYEVYRSGRYVPGLMGTLFSFVDKLISSGVECVNDIRALLGQPLINEPWAWKHFMTKNYADIEKVLTAVVEGEQT